jgi:hypothetical protein
VVKSNHYEVHGYVICSTQNLRFSQKSTAFLRTSVSNILKLCSFLRVRHDVSLVDSNSNINYTSVRYISCMFQACACPWSLGSLSPRAVLWAGCCLNKRGTKWKGTRSIHREFFRNTTGLSALYEKHLFKYHLTIRSHYLGMQCHVVTFRLLLSHASFDFVFSTIISFNLTSNCSIPSMSKRPFSSP